MLSGWVFPSPHAHVHKRNHYTRQYRDDTGCPASCPYIWYSVKVCDKVRETFTHIRECKITSYTVGCFWQGWHESRRRVLWKPCWMCIVDNLALLSLFIIKWMLMDSTAVRLRLPLNYIWSLKPKLRLTASTTCRKQWHNTHLHPAEVIKLEKPIDWCMCKLWMLTFCTL